MKSYIGLFLIALLVGQSVSTTNYWSLVTLYPGNEATCTNAYYTAGSYPAAGAGPFCLALSSATYIKVTLGSTSTITHTCTDSACSTCTALGSAITITTGVCSPTPVAGNYVQLAWTSATTYTLSGTTRATDCTTSASAISTITGTITANYCVDLGSSRYALVAQGVSSTTVEDCGTSGTCSGGTCTGGSGGAAAAAITSGTCFATGIASQFLTFTFSQTTTYTITGYLTFPSSIVPGSSTCPTTVPGSAGAGTASYCHSIGSSGEARYATVLYGSTMTVADCGTSSTCASGCGSAVAYTSETCTGLVGSQRLKITVIDDTTGWTVTGVSDTTAGCATAPATLTDSTATVYNFFCYQVATNTQVQLIIKSATAGYVRTCTSTADCSNCAGTWTAVTSGSCTGSTIVSSKYLKYTWTAAPTDDGDDDEEESGAVLKNVFVAFFALVAVLLF